MLNRPHKRFQQARPCPGQYRLKNLAFCHTKTTRNALNAASADSLEFSAIWLMSALVGASRNPLDTRSMSLPMVMHHKHATAPNDANTSVEAANMGLHAAVRVVPKMRILIWEPKTSPSTPEKDLETWHSSCESAWMLPIFCTAIVHFM